MKNVHRFNSQSFKVRYIVHTHMDLFSFFVIIRSHMNNEMELRLQTASSIVKMESRP